MKRLKKFASLMCAALISVSAFAVPVHAADSQTALQTVQALGIIGGKYEPVVKCYACGVCKNDDFRICL